MQLYADIADALLLLPLLPLRLRYITALYCHDGHYATYADISPPPDAAIIIMPAISLFSATIRLLMMILMSFRHYFIIAITPITIYAITLTLIDAPSYYAAPSSFIWP